MSGSRKMGVRRMGPIGRVRLLWHGVVTGHRPMTLTDDLSVTVWGLVKVYLWQSVKYARCFDCGYGYDESTERELGITNWLEEHNI